METRNRTQDITKIGNFSASKGDGGGKGVVGVGKKKHLDFLTF